MARTTRSWRMPTAGVFLDDGVPARVRHDGRQFDIAALFDVPRSPQGRPVIVQAGDSADGATSRPRTPTSSSPRTPIRGRAGVLPRLKGRLAEYGRESRGPQDPARRDLRPRRHPRRGAGAGRQIARQQVAPGRRSATWSRSGAATFSGYDPDGPLPDVEPDARPRVSSAGFANRARPRCGRGSPKLRELPPPKNSASAISSSGSPPTTRSSGRRSPGRRRDRPVRAGARDRRLHRRRSPDPARTRRVHRARHSAAAGARVVSPSYEEGATLRDLLGLPPVTALPVAVGG